VSMTFGYEYDISATHARSEERRAESRWPVLQDTVRASPWPKSKNSVAPGRLIRFPWQKKSRTGVDHEISSSHPTQEVERSYSHTAYLDYGGPTFYPVLVVTVSSPRFDRPPLPPLCPPPRPIPRS